MCVCVYICTYKNNKKITKLQQQAKVHNSYGYRHGYISYLNLFTSESNDYSFYMHLLTHPEFVIYKWMFSPTEL